MKEFIRNSRGGVLAVTAATLPIILVLMALCVDVGAHYRIMAQAEGIAATAAEAGLRRLASPAAAEEQARRVARRLATEVSLADSWNAEASVSGGRISVTVTFAHAGILTALSGRALPDIVATALRPL